MIDTWILVLVLTAPGGSYSRPMNTVVIENIVSREECLVLHGHMKKLQTRYESATCYPVRKVISK